MSIILAFLFSFTPVALAIDECFELFNLQKRHPSEVTEKLLQRTGLAVSQLSYSKLTPLQARSLNSIESTLKNSKIVEMKLIPNTSNTVYLIRFSDDTQAIWKAHTESWFSNYRAEVLTYEFDQLVGFNLAPPTVSRTIKNKKGSVQFYKESFEEGFAPMEQLDKQSFFDFLIDNRDRNASNYLVSIDDEVISIDNAVSFVGGRGSYHRTFFNRRSQINRFMKTQEGSEIMKRMKELDLSSLQKEVDEYLGVKDSERFIRRIRFALDYYQSLTRGLGGR